jgi:hypothetical protein
MTLLVVIGIIWFVCAVFNYGVAFAYFQGMFPASAKEYKNCDRALALFLMGMGPFGTPGALLLCTGRLQYGWRLR